MKFIDLNQLEQRIKSLDRPTPQQVVNLIMVMYRELTIPEYMHKNAIGLCGLDERPYERI